ncbi:MAG: amidase, partial [Chloroflexota bacterium]
MSEDATKESALAFRREQIRQAREQVWEVDAGERAPLTALEPDEIIGPGGSAPARSIGGKAGPSAQATPAKLAAAHWTAAELVAAYRSRTLSPVEVAEEALGRLERLQPELQAFITPLRSRALAAARQAERRYGEGTPLGPLDGVPVAVKDLIHIAGERTTAASRIMDGYIADEDAEVVRRLDGAGAVILGKTNLHEFAYGPSGDTETAHPAARNPWNREHVAGGSSSGSGVAVAAGICPIALGTDTGGSIRIPAALCGVTGLKPTLGRV